MLKQFVGFTYERPDVGIQPKFVTPIQKPIPEKASNSTGVMPSKDSTITAATSLSHAADTPQPSGPPQAAFGENPDLELLWEEGTQVFILRDRVTHVTRPIETRSTYRPRKPVSQAKGPSSPDTALEEACAEHGTPTRNVPAQAQKEDVLEVALKAGNLQIAHQLLENHSGMEPEHPYSSHVGNPAAVGGPRSRRTWASHGYPSTTARTRTPTPPPHQGTTRS